MSIPVHCRGCGALVGEDHGYAGLFSDFGSLGTFAGECPGKGKHPEPVRTETTVFFGLVTHTKVVYPETHTSSEWYSYAGPKKRLSLLLAMGFVGSDGILVNGTWCHSFGDGYAELQKA